DLRIRLDAQWELAGRGRWEDLLKVAASETAPRTARIHALWGLSQGRRFDAGVFDVVSEADDDELRAQAAKWYGEASAGTPERRSLAPLIADPSPRVRYHAAMAAGKARDASRIGDVVAMLEENAGKDAFLAHAGAFALRHLLDRSS